MISNNVKIKAQDLNVYYGKKQALFNVNLDIHSKEVTALIGPSGCGKSTFIRCINRMNDVIDICKIEGSIKIDDKEIIDKEQELVTEELKNSGKPEDIAKKISLGKMNKFKEENALLTQAWVMEPKKKVQDVLKELAISDLKIKEFSRIKIGE